MPNIDYQHTWQKTEPEHGSIIFTKVMPVWKSNECIWIDLASHKGMPFVGLYESHQICALPFLVELFLILEKKEKRGGHRSRVVVVVLKDVNAVCGRSLFWCFQNMIKKCGVYIRAVLTTIYPSTNSIKYSTVWMGKYFSNTLYKIHTCTPMVANFQSAVMPIKLSTISHTKKAAQKVKFLTSGFWQRFSVL